MVVGDVAGRVDTSGEAAPAGFAATVATAAAAAGSKVELVTRIGEDDAGDAVILALARAGIGHVATLRDAGRRTPVVGSTEDEAGPDLDEDAVSTTVESGPGPTLDGGDVGLALRYLSDYRVIVVAHATDRGVLDEVVTAAGWSGARLVVIASPGIEIARTQRGDRDRGRARCRGRRGPRGAVRGSDRWRGRPRYGICRVDRSQRRVVGSRVPSVDRVPMCTARKVR